MNILSKNQPNYDYVIRLLVLMLIIVWCLLIMMPFASVMLWSLILAIALHPIHTKLKQKLGGKPKTASTLIVTIILAVVMVPASFLVYSLASEVNELRTNFNAGELVIPPPGEEVRDWPVVGHRVFEVWKSASLNLDKFIEDNKEQIIAFGGKIGRGVMGALGGFLQITASLIIAGVLLVYENAGEEIRKFYRKLAGSRGDEFADLTKNTVSSVVKGVLGEAIILAAMFGVVFVLAGIPFPGLLTLVILVFAIVQIPASVVTVPLMVFLFASRDILPASIWSVVLLLVGASDNILTPIMLGKGAPVPMLVIFLGAIGGFILSGIIGLFTGAIVMSIGYSLFVSWLNDAATSETASD